MSEKEELPPIVGEMVEETFDGYDRRRHMRIPLRVPVTIIEGWTRVSFNSVNISVGGLFIETSFIYKTGTHLNLQFPLPGGDEPMKLIGEVRHHYRYNYIDSRGRHRILFGIGVRFVHIEDKYKERIENFIESRRESFLAARAASKS